MLSWLDVLRYCGNWGCLWQVEEDVLDDTVANKDALPNSGARVMKRGDERFSLTVRRVLRVKNIMGIKQ